MKNTFFCLSVALCSFFPASDTFAGSARDSVKEVFIKVQNISYDLMSATDSLANNGVEVKDEDVKNIIIDILGEIATEEFSKEWEKKIEFGLATGNKLAYCSEFDWAIPSLPSQYYAVSAVRIGQKEAAIICRGKIPDPYLALETYSIDFFGDSVSQYPRVENPWSKKYWDVKWQDGYVAMFIFKKTALGWKFSDFKVEFVNLEFARR